MSVTISGGDRLEAALRAMAAKVSNPGTLRVGWLENAKYPDGTSVALIAFINEYGAPSRGQPPRPAVRNMIADKRGEWPKAIGDLLKANNYDAAVTLNQAGQAIAGQLRQSIATITQPPLAPSTIKAKGFDKPWIETGFLLQSVDFEVKAA
jgi:hypothetical protein